MSKFITTKYGTRINVEGLTPQQIARVRETAEGKGAFGTKGAALAKQLQRRNNQGGRQQQGGEESAAINPTMEMDVPDLGLNAKDGTINTGQAANTLTGAEQKDALTNFNMNNPGSQTDILGNTQTISIDPNTGQVTKTQQGGALSDAAQGFLQGAIGTADQKANLDLSGEVEQIQGANLNLQPELAATNNSMVNFGNEINQLGNMKMDLSGAPRILQTGDAISEAQKVGQANFDFFTRNIDRDKRREMEETKQMLAERGIPIDYENKDSMWNKALGAIDEKYQGLTDQANQQALMAQNQTLESLSGVQSNAFNSFLQGTGMQFDANQGLVLNQANLKGAQAGQNLEAASQAAGLKGMEFDATTGKAKDAAALKGMEAGQTLNVLGAANNTIGTVNPQFTQYQGGQIDQSAILAGLLGLASGAAQGNKAINVDQKTKMAQINKPTGGGGGGGGFGITIGGVAP